MDVCHTCDNRACLNPAHLFIGTRQDNVDDAVKKGRHIKGEMQGLHKLTEQDVRAIRASNAKQSVLAVQYGVCQAQISRIKNRVDWRHI